MDLQEAYRRLRIQDMFIADDALLAQFVVCVGHFLGLADVETTDYPDEKGILTEALQVIGRARNSLSIKSFLSEQSTLVYLHD
jgi:A repeated domain in UCH-protein